MASMARRARARCMVRAAVDLWQQVPVLSASLSAGYKDTQWTVRSGGHKSDWRFAI